MKKSKLIKAVAMLSAVCVMTSGINIMAANGDEGSKITDINAAVEMQSDVKNGELSDSKATSNASDFVVENGVLTGYNGEGGDVVIPSNLGITEIGDNAFEGNSDLTSIKIPDGVTKIGNSAFYECGRLKSIEIPNGVTEIGNYVFKCCYELTSIKIPNGVTKIGDHTFSWCWGLKSIEIPNGVTEIGAYTFYECANLESIKISDGVTKIGDSAFDSCTSLESIKIPNGVTEIRDYVFFCCDNLTSIKIPDGVTKIGDSAFANCSELEKIDIPDSVTTIGKSAFSCCKLVNVVLPKRLSTIKKGTFSNCCCLKRLTIPNSVKSIAADSLYNVGLKYILAAKETGSNLGKSGFAIICKKGSYAEKFAKKYDYYYIYTNGSTSKVTAQKQTITAKKINKTYGDKAFKIGAKTDGDGKLTYSSSNENIVTVSANGKVAIKGCGKAKITIKAEATKKYKKATKTITVTVKPKRAAISSLKPTEKNTLTVKWKKDTKSTGYIIQCATDKEFTKEVKTITVSKNTTVSKTIPKLKAGKEYYVRVCSYKKSGSSKIQGDWSKVKCVKVKK